MWNKWRQAVRGWVIHLAIAFQVRLTCLATSLWHSPSNSLLYFEHLAWIIQHDWLKLHWTWADGKQWTLASGNTNFRACFAGVLFLRTCFLKRNVSRCYHSNCKLSRGVFVIGMKVMSPRSILRCLHNTGRLKRGKMKTRIYTPKPSLKKISWTILMAWNYHGT